jgi:hypothetical protein
MTTHYDYGYSYGYHYHDDDDGNNDDAYKCDYDCDMLLIDDLDETYDSSNDQTVLDTQWITDLENEMILNDYEMMIPADFHSLSFRFVYLARDKKTIEFTVPYSYVLQRPNEISQSELFAIIYRFQKKEKYYNFQSLLLYDFRLPGGDAQWLSSYLTQDNADDGHGEYGRVVEYTNLLSIDKIYFCPLISLFHSLVGFTVLLYED